MKREKAGIKCHAPDMKRDNADTKRHVPNMKRDNADMKCHIPDNKFNLNYKNLFNHHHHLVLFHFIAFAHTDFFNSTC